MNLPPNRPNRPNRRNWPVSIGPLTEAEQVEVILLAELATAVDGVSPLSEVPILHLSANEPWLTHVQVRRLDDSPSPSRSELVGYAQIDRSGETASAELVVLPDARRRGIGGVLLATADADARLPAVSGAGPSAGQELRVWAHGDLPGSQAFAASKGYQPVRELLLLSRPLTGRANHRAAEKSAAIKLPSGYHLRSFRPGPDDTDWVRLNALVFADHPEQGRLTVPDLHARQAEPWFKADDFQVVTSPTGEMIAFNWMKVETEAANAGEIYAIGVHPEHRRLGIAGYLLQATFTQMTAAGLAHTTLYVEGNNDAALATYYTAGFVPTARDMQYAKSPTT